TCTFNKANELALQVAADLSRTIQNLQPPPEQEQTSGSYLSSVASVGNFRQAIADLERSYDITLEALGDALDLKDAETEGHSKRVTAFTIAIARAMGVSAGDIRVIARGAFLHDIGKMAIPDAILRKPGSLTPEETAILREHCFRGYQMIRKIPFLKEAAEIVYAHEERFDGTGYPRGLRGEEIPLGARIFSVADTLDAMTSDRPYHAAQPISIACHEIARFSEKQFDPTVVNTFLQMPEALWQDLRQEINSQSYRFTYPLKALPSEPLRNTPPQILAELEAQRDLINLEIKKIKDQIRRKSGAD
ncbi:MAG TPA: HD-GYP domain-containing protein, partial [Candidatus Angelobacter sp.]